MYAELKSHALKFWRPRPKGREMDAKTWVFFVTGTMNSHFFVTGQVGMKFGNKLETSIEHLLRTEAAHKIKTHM